MVIIRNSNNSDDSNDTGTGRHYRTFVLQTWPVSPARWSRAGDERIARTRHISAKQFRAAGSAAAEAW